MKIQRGDLVQVDWEDILHDPVGNPDNAKLARRTTFGLFWEWRSEGGTRTLVITNTVDGDDDTQVGYCILPASCVARVALTVKGAANRSSRWRERR